MIYPISWLFIAFVSLILGIFVYFKGKESITNISWGLFSVSISICGLGFFMTLISPNKKLALFWVRFLNSGAILLPVFFLQFVFSLLGKYYIKKKTLILAYFLAFIFLGSNFTNFFISDVEPKFNFKYWVKPGILYPFFIVGFLWCVLYAHYFMFTTYKELSEYKRNQIRFVLLASIIGFIGGITTFPLAFNIYLYPFGSYLIAFYPIIISYAITRHRLMDIEVVIKKSLVFAGTFSFVMSLSGRERNRWTLVDRIRYL